MNGRSRSWCFTTNNYSEQQIEQLGLLECRYLLYGKELGSQTGTRHLQGYVVFKNAHRFNTVRGLLPGSSIRIARGNSLQNYNYCTKEGREIFEKGERPLTPGEKGDQEKERWQQVIDAAKSGDLEKIQSDAPDVFVRQYHTIKRIQQDFMETPEDLPDVCGLWITGLSGAGKSHAAYNTYPQAFRKPRNKWWDGYMGQEVVVIDDIGLTDIWAGGFLKNWADKFGFIGEFKGGSRTLRPRKLIVTSQYKIDQLWPDQETKDALERRFTVVEKIKNQNIII